MKSILTVIAVLALAATTVGAEAKKDGNDPGGGPGGPVKEQTPKEPKGGK